MRIAASLDGATFSAPVIISTPPRYDAVMAMLKKSVSDFAGEHKIRAIAGGLPGVFDREKTKILRSPNLPLWEAKPIAEEFMSKFRVPVILENDSALGGLGEALHGAGIGRKIVAYIAIGTGIGGARIVEGRIDERSHGFEPGHQIIDCGSGRDLESMISGRALGKQYKKVTSENAAPARLNGEGDATSKAGSGGVRSKNNIKSSLRKSRTRPYGMRSRAYFPAGLQIPLSIGRRTSSFSAGRSPNSSRFHISPPMHRNFLRVFPCF